MALPEEDVSDCRDRFFREDRALLESVIGAAEQDEAVVVPSGCGRVIVLDESIIIPAVVVVVVVAVEAGSVDIATPPAAASSPISNKLVSYGCSFLAAISAAACAKGSSKAAAVADAEKDEDDEGAGGYTE